MAGAATAIKQEVGGMPWADKICIVDGPECAGDGQFVLWMTEGVAFLGCNLEGK